MKKNLFFALSVFVSLTFCQHCPAESGVEMKPIPVGGIPKVSRLGLIEDSGLIVGGNYHINTVTNSSVVTVTVTNPAYTNYAGEYRFSHIQVSCLLTVGVFLDLIFTNSAGVQYGASFSDMIFQEGAMVKLLGGLCVAPDGIYENDGNVYPEVTGISISGTRAIQESKVYVNGVEALSLMVERELNIFSFDIFIHGLYVGVFWY